VLFTDQALVKWHLMTRRAISGRSYGQGGSYLGASIPLTVSTLTAVEVLSMGFAEVGSTCLFAHSVPVYPYALAATSAPPP